ncbi:enoyl-CoA hydratase-related protein [Xanthobacter sp. DSM 24535]|uniref:enoyl-CoA hydratase/isomerase family protein n=1 Tax=Roseixanthobacter psychrophilus TaxID=3119917 RepID=UPI00372B5B33
MSESQSILLSVTDGIARLRFNRPQVLNALNEEMIVAFRDAARTIAADDTVRAVVLSGEGRAFLAGGDVGRFHAAGVTAPDVVSDLIVPFHEAITLLNGLAPPVIASVKGAVAGGGLSVAMAADLVIAADDTRFTMAYSRIGTSTDGSASWSLPRVVGLRKALELALLSDVIDAPEALRIGLINKVVPLAELESQTDALAARLAAGPTLALGRIKALMRGAFDNTLAAQLDAERAAFIACASTRDFAEGAAAFVEKRPAIFVGK